MKIAINLFGYSGLEYGGPREIAKNLLPEVIKIAKKDQFFIFGYDDLDPRFRFSGENVKLILIRRPFFVKKYRSAQKPLSVKLFFWTGKLFFEQMQFLFFRFRHKIDIFFNPDFMCPYFYKNYIKFAYDCRNFPGDNLVRNLYYKTLFYNAKYFEKKY